MRLMVIAGFLLTFPAIVVLVYALLFGRPLLALGAGASFVVNSLPFIVGMFLFRTVGGKGASIEH